MYSKILSLLLLVLLSACNRGKLVLDQEYLDAIDSKFIARTELIGEKSDYMIQLLESGLTRDEDISMRFMFASMPLSDVADYSGRFFLDNVRLALRTREETGWGRDVPGEIFLHFVLPVRVNNENLDSFRIKYFDEINGRVNGFTDPGEAALEINHWCHEKVAYQAADIRTSAPISTMLSARGRCGEESTFTVAALRCAGIPARQVYVPRWAHTDDNHAWVEVWIDGNWRYMGACEPEPILDRGWFTEPARRAMLIHTKTFGAYFGNETALFNRENYSEINNLAKYAVTKDVTINVTNPDGTPASNAVTEFQLFNYAEFYPIATLPVDEKGYATFRTGLGDLLVWARDGDYFSFKKISVKDTDTIFLSLTNGNNLAEEYRYDLLPPSSPVPLPGIDKELIETNNVRLSEENRIRKQYIDSWIDADSVASLALLLNYPRDIVADMFARSMGNYGEIASFLLNISPRESERALSLLSVIPDKDMRDTRAEILADHLDKSFLYPKNGNNYSKEFYDSYILNPRIVNEILTPWRSVIITKLENQGPVFIANPASITEWITDNIRLNSVDNYYNVPISPEGVLNLGMADKLSAEILMIAICRSFGIAARLEPGTLIPQYWFNGKWINAPISGKDVTPEKYGFLKLISSGGAPTPEYYKHFTLARFENGRFNTLEYSYNKKVAEFDNEIPLAPGRYMLVTGNRLNDSRILSSLRFFDIAESEVLTLDVLLRTEDSSGEYLGKLDTEILEKLFSGKGRGERFVLAWIEHGKEPTRHLLNELPELKDEFDSDSTHFVFLLSSDQSRTLFVNEGMELLPASSSAIVDTNLLLLKDIDGNLDASTIRLPFIICSDGDGNILFRSEGYSIGTADKILNCKR